MAKSAPSSLLKPRNKNNTDKWQTSTKSTSLCWTINFDKDSRKIYQISFVLYVVCGVAYGMWYDIRWYVVWYAMWYGVVWEYGMVCQGLH